MLQYSGMVEKGPSRETGETGESILDREFVETLLTIAQENLKSQGSLLPALFLDLESGERAMISPELPSTSEERKLMFSALGLSIHLSGQRIREALFVSEVWFVTDEDAPLEGPPAEHPNRREAISIMGRDAGNTRATYLLQPFTRNQQNQPVFGKKEFEGYNAPTDKSPQRLDLVDALFPPSIRG